MNIGIVGTAGRKEDFNKLSKSKFQLMALTAEDYITQTLMLSWNDVTLVSGGAAWADHIAVQLFLKHREQGAKLQLYLPANIRLDDQQFTEEKHSTIVKSRFDPGRIANYYHSLFKENTGIRSLKEITQAVSLGAKFFVEKGFKERNSLVADNVDFLLAFTFGEGEFPKDGGTKDTWDKCSAPKMHFPIDKLKRAI